MWLYLQVGNIQNSVYVYHWIQYTILKSQFLPKASFGLQVLLLPASVHVYQSIACPCDNSRPAHTRITKFGSKMKNTLVKMPMVLGGNRPWPSRSNLILKSNFIPFWACLHHNSSPIQARITKFGPKVQNASVKIPIIWGQLNLTFKVKFDLKCQIFWLHHYWKYITTIKPPESHDCLDCFTGLSLSGSPSSTGTYIHRLFHGSCRFTVSTLSTYTDLGRSCLL